MPNDGNAMGTNVGILAYGSLIDDPGREIAAATTEVLRLGVWTPFSVEFARSSRSRAGAPTLVPVSAGGSRIPAHLLCLRHDVSETDAEDMLWRRETGLEGRAPPHASGAGPNDVIIDRLVDFRDIPLVLYVRIAPNITNPTPRRLAELALRSARSAEVGRKERDGISYLIAALRNGARTRLSAAYEREVLRLTGAACLAGALERTRRKFSDVSPTNSVSSGRK